MPLMNYDRASLSTILNNLLNNTDTKLREVQKMKCPRYVNIELEEISSKTYRYMEKDYTTTKRLFRVNNPKEIYKGGLSSAYNGNIKVLFDNGNLVPFLLYINQKHIAWSKIDCIVDGKVMYLAFNYSGLSLTLGDDTAPVSTTTFSRLPLCKVDTEYLDSMVLEVNVTDTSKITSVRLDDSYTLTPNTTTATKFTYNLTRAQLTAPMFHNMKHNVSIVASQSIGFKTIKFYSNIIVESAIVSVDTLVIPIGKIDYQENVSSTSTTVFTDYKFVLNNAGQLMSNINTRLLPYFVTTVCFSFPYYTEISIFGKDRIHPVISNKYKLFKENILVDDTKASTSDGNASLTELGLNVFSTSRSYGYLSYAKIFYYYEELTKDKLLVIDEKISLAANLIAKTALPPYTNSAHVFDYQYDVAKSYDENMDLFVKYIADYDSTLLSKYTDSKKYLYTKSYLISDIIPNCTVVNTDYKYIVPKDINGQKNNGAMVFLDGLIYDFTKIIDRRTFYEIYFPTTTATTSVLEVVLVANVNNNKFTINLANANTSLSVGNIIPLSDIELHSSHYLSHNYPITEVESLQYKIPFTKTDIDSISTKITMDSSYYNRNITITSKRQFVFDTYTLASEGMVVLSDKFKYCNNPMQYMTFHNGRMINNANIHMLLNDPTKPFDKKAIFIPNIVQAGDKITVVYLPERIRETHISEGLTEDGFFNLSNQHKMKYSYLFVNGKKVPLRDIIVISNDTIKIKKDTKSFKNVYLYDNVSVLDDLLTYIKTTTEMWSTVVKAMDKTTLKTLCGDSSLLTNTETDITTNWYTNQMVMFEIIRKFFIENDPDFTIDAADVFYYDLDTSILDDGVIPLDASIDSINELPENTIA